MVICKMQHLYTFALEEGEGLGTAYEYFVKLRLLNRLLKHKKIKDVLIYGLPERYGYSLDFFYFCFINNFNLSLFEKNQKKNINLKKILLKLKNKKIKIIKKIDKKYDLILSCEVLQSLKKNDLKKFVLDIQKYSKYAIIFVPNKNNKNHRKISGLDGFTLEELSSLFKNINKSGYIDMPPFPPGIKTKKKIAISADILKPFAYLEEFVPSGIKKKNAHIAYVLIDNRL